MAINPLLLQAGITMPGASAFALAATDLTPVVAAPFEPLATYNWVFGADNADLADAVSGARLRRNVALAIGAGGTGYEASGNLTFSGGGATIHATGIWFASGGVINEVLVTSPGDYTSSPTVAVQTATGTGAAVTGTLQAAPALAANYLTIADNARNGLLTSIPDSTEDTEIAIFQIEPDATSSQFVFGNFPSGGSYSLFGGAFYQQNTTSDFFTNDRNGGGPNAVARPAAMVAGTWAFAAVVHKADGTRYVWWGAPAPSTVNLSNFVRKLPATTAPLKKAIGNAYYMAGGFAKGVKIAEYMYLPKAATAAELGAIYTRAKERQANRGLAVH